MLDGRAQEEQNVVIITGLTLDQHHELWALLMAARVCIDESPGPTQPDLFIHANELPKPGGADTRQACLAMGK